VTGWLGRGGGVENGVCGGAVMRHDFISAVAAGSIGAPADVKAQDFGSTKLD